MNYIGTRDNTITATASQAILEGICKDGGLFIPEQIPQIDKTLLERLNNVVNSEFGRITYTDAIKELETPEELMASLVFLFWKLFFPFS